MTLCDVQPNDDDKTSVAAVKAVTEHCKELESLLLYILQEGMTKEAYRRIGECLKESAK